MTSSADDDFSALERVLLGGDPAFTRDETVTELGMDEEFADSLWRAFGFAHDPRDEMIFTEADVAALGWSIAAYRTSPEGAVSAARSIGQTMSRLAEWQAERLHTLAADPESEISIAQLAEAVGRVQSVVWRRHLISALRNLAVGAGPDDRTADLIVGFCDIVGYTSLSRKIGMQQLNSLLETFEGRATDIVISHGGRVVKTLGDAVMFLVDNPVAATEIALELHEISGDEIPQLRVGIARGAVLLRFGDVFGEPVNIAARLTGSARPGTSLCDATFADAVDDYRFYFKSIGTLSVRGYRHLKARVIEYDRDHVPDSSR